MLGIPDHSRCCLFDLDRKPRTGGTRSFPAARGIGRPDGSDARAGQAAGRRAPGAGVVLKHLAGLLGTP